jgi:2-polyprenyl-3-methyl-5-hydroxy-6-metoxy-1,4-benzoquinol methylase
MSRFDQLAAEWDTNLGRVALAAGVAEAMRAVVPFAPHWRVLDFGAGTGLLSLNLAPAVAEVIAVDSSAAMLEVLAVKAARAGLSQVTVWHGDLQAAPWPGPPVDAVVSTMTLHHLRAVPQVLRALVQAVRPGGWLALADLDTEDGGFHGPEVDDVYHHGFDRQQVSAWLAAAGCVGVAVTEAWRAVRPDGRGGSREYPVFLASARRGEDPPSPP